MERAPVAAGGVHRVIGSAEAVGALAGRLRLERRHDLRHQLVLRQELVERLLDRLGQTAA